MGKVAWLDDTSVLDLVALRNGRLVRFRRSKLIDYGEFRGAELDGANASHALLHSEQEAVLVDLMTAEAERVKSNFAIQAAVFSARHQLAALSAPGRGSMLLGGEPLAPLCTSADVDFAKDEAAFDPEGRRLIVSSKGRHSFIDVKTCALVHRSQSKLAGALSTVSEDGTRVATRSADGSRIEVLKSARPDQVRTISTPYGGSIDSLDWVGDARFWITQGSSVSRLSEESGEVFSRMRLPRFEIGTFSNHGRFALFSDRVTLETFRTEDWSHTCHYWESDLATLTSSPSGLLLAIVTVSPPADPRWKRAPGGHLRILNLGSCEVFDAADGYTLSPPSE